MPSCVHVHVEGLGVSSCMFSCRASAPFVSRRVKRSLFRFWSCFLPNTVRQQQCVVVSQMSVCIFRVIKQTKNQGVLWGWLILTLRRRRPWLGFVSELFHRLRHRVNYMPSFLPLRVRVCVEMPSLVMRLLFVVPFPLRWKTCLFLR